MKNIAGAPEPVATEQCAAELMEAGITVLRHKVTPERVEVKSRAYGQLGHISFRRNWYYWVAEGRVPLDIATLLYLDPIGKKDVRVEGDAGCPTPDKWARWYMHNGVQVLSLKDKEIATSYLVGTGILKECGQDILDHNCFSDDPASTGALPYIETYHIDSQEGLNLFARVLRKHGVVL
jgi:hypothetical protein